MVLFLIYIMLKDLLLKDARVAWSHWKIPLYLVNRCINRLISIGGHGKVETDEESYIVYRGGFCWI